MKSEIQSKNQILRELKDIFGKAGKELEKVPRADRTKYAYVDSPDAEFSGLMEIGLPSFWSEELSKAYGSTLPTTGDTVHPRPIPRKERKKKVIELRETGYSIREIAKMTGLPKSTVHRIRPHSSLDYRPPAPEVYEPMILEPITLTLEVVQ